MLIAVAYMLGHADAFVGAGVGDPDAQAVARNLVLLMVAWAVLSQVMSSRWKGAIEEDERDREIATKAAGRGRAALVLCVIGGAVMLGVSPADKLRWAGHFMIAPMLVFALMWGWVGEGVATTMLYLDDRRAARGAARRSPTRSAACVSSGAR